MMKYIKASLAALAVLLGAVQAGDVLAHGRGHFHSRAHVGVFVGVPLVAPWYYPPPYYFHPRPYYPYPYQYYPPVVSMPASPPVYIERGVEGITPAPSNYWYYCPDLDGYYPYVKDCPAGWQRVPPHPPPG